MLAPSGPNLSASCHFLFINQSITGGLPGQGSGEKTYFCPPRGFPALYSERSFSLYDLDSVSVAGSTLLHEVKVKVKKNPFWPFFFLFMKYREKKKNTVGKRGQGVGTMEGGGTERLVRSRSYPGFSIGILLSVKVILQVNSVFIPLLNEIHRSTGRESESNSSSLFFLSLLPPPFGHTIANENTAWDKQLLSD